METHAKWIGNLSFVGYGDTARCVVMDVGKGAGRGLSDNHVARAIDPSVAKYCPASATFAAAVDLSHDYEIVEREQGCRACLI